MIIVVIRVVEYWRRGDFTAGASREGNVLCVLTLALPTLLSREEVVSPMAGVWGLVVD